MTADEILLNILGSIFNYCKAIRSFHVVWFIPETITKKFNSTYKKLFCFRCLVKCVLICDYFNASTLLFDRQLLLLFAHTS